MFKRMISLMLVLLLLTPSAFAAETRVNSREALYQAVLQKLSERTETFTIHYKGTEDLLDIRKGLPLFNITGTEAASLIGLAYTFDSVDTRFTYLNGHDITLTFSVKYEHGKPEIDRLNRDLDTWVSNTLTPDMPDAVKSAIISRYVADRLRYSLAQETNNAYDGYYGGTSACAGYAELVWRLHQKAGIPVKLVVGYIPKGLTETEYLAKRVSVADLTRIADGTGRLDFTELHAWNMVQISGQWHHLDVTWMDTDAQESENPSYQPEFFLGGDDDFGRNHIWVREEYPTGTRNWWDQGADPVRDFVKGYLETEVFDYPILKTRADFEAALRKAYEDGEAAQTFRVQQGVQSYDQLPVVEGLKNQIQRVEARYQTAPEQPGDRYLLTVWFRGRTESPPELSAPERALTLERGTRIPVTDLLPEATGQDAVRILPLSRDHLKLEGDGITAVQSGTAYVGIYGDTRAAVVPLRIDTPPLRVALNGQDLSLEPSAVNLQGRVLVPMRALMEAMGAEISYDPLTRTIVGVRGTDSVKLVLDTPKVWVGGVEKPLDTAPVVLNGRTYVPARVVAESLGASVEWDGLRNRVGITDEYSLAAAGNEEAAANSSLQD